MFNDYFLRKEILSFVFCNEKDFGLFTSFTGLSFEFS